MDYYTDLSAILDAFAAFANKVPFYGSAILCMEDPNVQAVIPRIQRRIVAYGTSGQADLRASHIEFADFGAACSVSHQRKPRG
jgi:UDP-N-acetylmuramate--alanine ligase